MNRLSMIKRTLIVLLILLLSYSVYPENKKKDVKEENAKENFSFLKNENYQRNKRLGRASIEFFTLMGYWQTRYWLIYTDYIEDWQFEFNFKDQSKRFYASEAYRLDSNCYSLNWLHAIAGAGFYTVARSNYYGWAKSLLFSTLGSTYWEYVVEWREVISLNDMVITPIGGFSIGEALFQIGDHYNSKKGLLNQILSFVISPMAKINRWMDRKKAPIQLDRMGWGKFDISLGYEKLKVTDNEEMQLFHFGFDNKIITVPEYGKTGNYHEFLNDTLYSRLYVSLSYAKSGIEEVNIFAKVVFLGLFSQSINKDGKGYSLSLGLGSRFDFFKRRGIAFYDSCDAEVDDGKSLELEKPREFTDKYTIVNIAGPAFDYSIFNKDFRLKLSLEGYLDFVMINSFAINDYSKHFDISKVKTTLLYYGYYYGYGYTVQTGFEGEYKNLSFSGSIMYGSYRSIQGLDRFQDKITDDFLLKDWVVNYSFDIAYRINSTPVEVFFSLNSRDRRGKIFSLEKKGNETRLVTGIRVNL